MLIYLVRTNDGRGLAGPTPISRDIMDYEPPEELRGCGIEVVAVRDDVERVIKVWDWEKSSWTWVNRAAIEAREVKVEVVFGALVRPLSEQLDGLGFSDEQIEHWQKDIDAIDRLRIRGYISELTAHKAYKNLAGRIK